jgi:RimJ/RimL family protein N-acetyltransferase
MIRSHPGRMVTVQYTRMAFSIDTERLSLRLRDERDAEWNNELLGEHDEPASEPIDELRRRMAAQRTRSLQTGIGLLAIRRRGDGEPLGYCGLVVGRGTLDEPELAYELLRRHHGSGYATEAARAVAAAAFATGRTRLWATVGTWNTPSFRVLDKLGFRRDRVGHGENGEFVYLVLDAAQPLG